MKNKRFYKKSCLQLPGVFKFACLLTAKISPRVLVYHRFCEEPGVDSSKIDKETFNLQLKEITKRFKVITLEEYLNMKFLGLNIPKNIAIITIDDGYLDFYNIAFPLLKAYNIKATLFPVVNFIEKKIWLWPDRISHALGKTTRKICSIKFDDRIFNLDLSTIGAQNQSFKRLIDYAIAIDDRLKWAFIERLEDLLGITPPKLPPAPYLPVSWRQIKEMKSYGIEIGSHTMNHPILSRIDSQGLHEEVFSSKRVLEERLGGRVSSFCYPNSYPEDINDQVLREVQDAGYKGAVFYLLPGRDDPYRIPRIPASNNMTDFLWQISGMEYLVDKAKSNSIQSIKSYKNDEN